MDEDLRIIEALTAPRPVGPYWDLVDGPSPEDRHRTIRLGVRNETFWIANRTGTCVAQYFALVRFGLRDAVHLYRGLQRGMRVEGDMHADEKVLAYVWRPNRDVEWVGGRHSTAMLEARDPPPGRVFVVLARTYAEPDQYGVTGALLRWNWVDGDKVFEPQDAKERYKEKLWRENQ